MKVTFNNIFGDEYIKALAFDIGTEGYNITNEGIEFDDLKLKNELQNIVDTMKEQNKKRQETMEKKGKSQPLRLEIPLSGNEKQTWSKVLSCLKIPNTSTLADALEYFINNMMETYKCEITPPSYLRPEFYEFIRVPGTPGGDKNDIKVPLEYFLISSAGWYITRIGRAQVNPGEYVGVNVVPETPSASLLRSLVNPYGILPGIKPETALALYLAWLISSKGLSPERLKVYIMDDAVGMGSTTLRGEISIDMARLLSDKDLVEDPNLRDIATEALRIDAKDKNYAIRLSNLIFEVLNRSKSVEELLYVANRELLVETKANMSDEKLNFRRKAANYARKILNQFK